MLVISAHGDTCFQSHQLHRLPGGRMRGHLDNFAGVYSVMKAYFSGRFVHDCVRIELTYGEEAGCLGAMEVVKALHRQDLVVVVDVTGAPTDKDFTVEKCRDASVREFLGTAFQGLSYDLYEGCPDPVSDEDESDIYARKCPCTFFLGVPVQGGDYNVGQVRCRERSLEAVSEALCRLAEAYPRFGPKGDA